MSHHRVEFALTLPSAIVGPDAICRTHTWENGRRAFQLTPKTGSLQAGRPESRTKRCRFRQGRKLGSPVRCSAHPKLPSPRDRQQTQPLMRGRSFRPCRAIRCQVAAACGDRLEDDAQCILQHPGWCWMRRLCWPKGRGDDRLFGQGGDQVRIKAMIAERAGVHRTRPSPDPIWPGPQLRTRFGCLR